MTEHPPPAESDALRLVQPSAGQAPPAEPAPDPSPLDVCTALAALYRSGPRLRFTSDDIQAAVPRAYDLGVKAALGVAAVEAVILTAADEACRRAAAVPLTAELRADEAGRPAGVWEFFYPWLSGPDGLEKRWLLDPESRTVDGVRPYGLGPGVETYAPVRPYLVGFRAAWLRCVGLSGLGAHPPRAYLVALGLSVPPGLHTPDELAELPATGDVARVLGNGWGDGYAYTFARRLGHAWNRLGAADFGAVLGRVVETPDAHALAG